jgi:hypothetical protein
MIFGRKSEKLARELEQLELRLEELETTQAADQVAEAAADHFPRLIRDDAYGGRFPSDDVTQAPNSDMSVTLGKQDTTYNGLYLNVSVTVSDPAQNCASLQAIPQG